MTRDQLDAIRARVEAATPGPWEAGTAVCCPDVGWVGGPRRTVCPVYEGTKPTHTLDANDAEFIAHAREDVPALLAEVERLTAEVEMLRGVGCMENGDGPCGVCRKCAFRRGVAAMREAAVTTLESAFAAGDNNLFPQGVAYGLRLVRALPDPEDTE